MEFCDQINHFPVFFRHLYHQIYSLLANLVLVIFEQKIAFLSNNSCYRKNYVKEVFIV